MVNVGMPLAVFIEIKNAQDNIDLKSGRVIVHGD